MFQLKVKVIKHSVSVANKYFVPNSEPVFPGRGQSQVVTKLDLMGDSKRLKGEEGRLNQSLPLPPPPRMKSDAERIADLERQLLDRDKVVLELRKQAASTKGKLESLTRELEDRIKCPVCLDMPSSGPIFTCPRGHCICKSCYQVY